MKVLLIVVRFVAEPALGLAVEHAVGLAVEPVAVPAVAAATASVVSDEVGELTGYCSQCSEQHPKVTLIVELLLLTVEAKRENLNKFNTLLKEKYRS